MAVEILLSCKLFFQTVPLTIVCDYQYYNNLFCNVRHVHALLQGYVFSVFVYDVFSVLNVQSSALSVPLFTVSVLVF